MTTTATQDLSDTNIITIQPNPSDRQVVINSLNLKEGLYYSLVDPLGREVIERRSVDIDKRIDISSLPAGLYYMSITDKSGTIMKVEKLIKSEIK